MKSLRQRLQDRSLLRVWSVRQLRAASAAVAVTAMALGVAGAATATTTYSDSPTQVPPGYTAPSNDGLGITPGKIKHVWLIIMENKSYDATFTGLNGNSYLWQSLPEQGALLTNYYGTGHSSEDNYLSMVSGQAPISDDQSDCPNYTTLSGSIDTTGSLTTNQNYGQFDSAAGPNAPIGDNGCVYPEASSTQSSNNPSNTVETIFNQLDAAGESWKVYAQDLYGDDDPHTGGDTAVQYDNNVVGSTSHSAGPQYCGAPYSSPGVTPSSSQTVNPATVDANPGSANPVDQYVPKHNPAPWFESVLQSGDCDTHVAPILGANDQFATDLSSESTTPALSVIVPDNCSDAHDAVCAGNNLSGGFSSTYPQEANPPTNYTGGLYAGDLFLEKVVPEIEASPAFSDGGLIDVVFDEAFPPYTWQNSFVNSTLLPSTAFGSVTTDEAGETLYGRSVNWEPQGPNVPITYSATGQVLTPGAGFGSGLDRPSASTAVAGATVGCSSGTTGTNGWVTAPNTGCLLMGASTTPGATSTTALAGTFTAGSATVTLPNTIGGGSLGVKYEGREVTSISNGADANQESIDGGYFVGNVTSTYDPTTSKANTQYPYVTTFQLVNANGTPVTDLPASGSFTFGLGAQTAATDPLYDAYDPTLGGGDTGAVLISPYIKPGTVSNNYYNHYSLLRTLEDLFQVDKTGSGTAAALTTQGGLDGEGHLGYAAQPGLAPFGTDVFTNSDLANPVTTVTQTTTVSQTVTAPGSTVTEPGSTVTTAGATVTDTSVTPEIEKEAECVVPNVKGYELPEAKAIIQAAQCRVGSIRGDRKGVVSAESLPKGKHVNAHTSISLKFKAH